MLFLQLALLAILGAIAELDRTSVFHGLFSEPIVLAPVVGLILGEPVLGLKVGAILQLFFLGSVSMGGSSPPDGAIAALVVTAAAVMGADYANLTSQVATQVAVPVAVLLVMAPSAQAGKAVYEWLKERNVSLVRQAEEDIVLHGVNAVKSALWRSVASSFAVFALMSVVLTSLGAAITGMALIWLPRDWWSAMEISGWLLTFAAAGVALAAVREKRAMWVYGGAGALLLAITVYTV